MNIDVENQSNEVNSNKELLNGDNNQNYFNSYYENLEHQETAKLLKNSIRKVRLKIISDQNYLHNLKSTGKERYNSKRPSSSNNISKIPLPLQNSDDKLDKIQLLEFAFRKKVEEKYREKLDKRNNTLKKYELIRQEKLKKQNDDNIRRINQSKIYFNQYYQSHENEIKNYLGKDLLEKQKVQKALDKKQKEINEITSYNNFKLSQAKIKHENFLSELENQSNVKFNNSKNDLIKSYYCLKMPEKPNENCLDKLKKSGKLNQMQTSYNKSMNLIKTKITFKRQKYEQNLIGCLKNREKDKLTRMMMLENKHHLAFRNRRIQENQRNVQYSEILNKSKATSLRVKNNKDQINSFYYQRKKFDLLRKEIKDNFENLLHSKKNFTDEYMRSFLRSLIPSEFIQDDEILDEIDQVCFAVNNYLPNQTDRSNMRGVEEVSKIFI